jgi:hypothetical protein
MKNILYKYIFLVSFITLLVGCNDDFLQKYPLDQISNETFWTTETDLANYNNQLYNIIKDDDTYPIMMGLSRGPGVRYTEGLWWWDEMSDNLGATHGRAQWAYEVRCGKHAISDNPRVGGYKGWSLLRTINFGLENYNSNGLSEAATAKYAAEARLIRAWFMSDKVRKFGDVQWVDKVLNIDDEDILYGARDDREFVMDKILEDLDFAVANLPENWGDGEPGRIDKWVALAVKSRVCLFEGTWRKYHGGSEPDKWLTECANASKELMDNGGFSLYSNGKPYEDYRFTHWQTSQDGNPEVIYWRKYVAGLNGHFASRLFWNYNGGATKDFVDDFLCMDGKPIKLSDQYMGDAQIEDVFENRDPRLMQCVLDPRNKEAIDYARDPNNDYPRITGMNGGRNRSNTGYHVVKHWNAIDEGSPRNMHTVSPPCLRLGEILLNYAEAKAELGSITQGDLDMSINLLRDRVAMPHLDLNPPMDPKYANDGVSSLIIEIRRERRVELFLEESRYHDIRRWKQGQKFAKSDLGIRWDDAAKARYGDLSNIRTTEVDGVPYIDVRKGTDYEPVWDDKMYLWPLPISAISQNPNLSQNPGWQ